MTMKQTARYVSAALFTVCCAAAAQAQVNAHTFRVAITGAGQSGVFRHTEMEQALSANFSPDAIKSIQTSPDGLNGDIHASPEYRAHLIGVMARRCVAGA